MTVAARLLWTTVEDRLDGVALIIRGELSTATAPALDSLVAALVDSGEKIIFIDLRQATVLAPASERMLDRWGACPDKVPGTYAISVATETGASSYRAKEDARYALVAAEVEAECLGGLPF